MKTIEIPKSVIEKGFRWETAKGGEDFNLTSLTLTNISSFLALIKSAPPPKLVSELLHSRRQNDESERLSANFLMGKFVLYIEASLPR